MELTEKMCFQALKVKFVGHTGLEPIINKELYTVSVSMDWIHGLNESGLSILLFLFTRTVCLRV